MDEDFEMEDTGPSTSQSSRPLHGATMHHPLESSLAPQSDDLRSHAVAQRRKRHDQLEAPKVRIVATSQDAAILQRFESVQETLLNLTGMMKSSKEAAEESKKASEAAITQVTEHRQILDNVLERLAWVEKPARAQSDISTTSESREDSARKDNVKGRDRPGRARSDISTSSESPENPTGKAKGKGRARPVSIPEEDDDVDNDDDDDDDASVAQRYGGGSDSDRNVLVMQQGPWKTRYTKNREASRRHHLSDAQKVFQRAFPFSKSDDEAPVPPPRKFKPTRGGAGRTIRLMGFDTGPSSGPTSSRVSPSEKVGREGEEFDDLGDIAKDSPEAALAIAFAKLGRSIDRFALATEHGMQAKVGQRAGRRSTIFPAPPMRNADSSRTAMLGEIRRQMNLLLNIDHDEDIVTSEAANADNEDQVSAFENDETHSVPEPTLYPFRPSWNNLRGPWNTVLAFEFQAYMLKQVGLPRYLTEDIREAFFARLERLKRTIRQSELRSGETTAQRDIRLQRQKEERDHKARVNARRFHLNVKRLEVSHERRDTASESKAWTSIAACIDKLGAAGMSSDDSDGEDGRTVRKMPWRSKKITTILKIVDKDALRTTDGRRQRRSTARKTRRNAPPGLPKNFYDDDWIASLREHERLELGCALAFPIPEIEVD